MLLGLALPGAMARLNEARFGWPLSSQPLPILTVHSLKDPFPFDTRLPGFLASKLLFFFFFVPGF